MSLEKILLTMLDDPATGYELKREFEAGALTFWPALPSQIYATLGRMAENGLLESSNEPSPKGPERRVYRRTPRGTDQLEAWLRSGPEIGRERFAYIAQLSGIGMLDEPHDIGAQLLLQLRHWFSERLQHLRGIESQMLRGEQPESLDDRAFFDWAALQMGLTALDARVRCCVDLLRALEARSPGAGAATTRQPHSEESGE